MEKHFLLSDTEFEEQFSNGSLKPVLFTHKAHLRLAWIHVNKYGIDQAISNITTQIKNYTVLVGAPDKYHETITVAAIRAVYHFMLKSDTTNFKDFIAKNPRLENNFKELLDSHYSIDLFKSFKAKSEYLEPDLLPFD